MIFSFVIAYRNRDAERVKNCLQSLQNQDFEGAYEIIFIDYGSDYAYHKSIKELCLSFNKVNYYYYDTRGWLWNKSQALNWAISQSSGKYLIIVDIDLIYPPYFLNVLQKKTDENSFVQYQCYYLPEGMNCDNLSFKKKYSYRVSRIATGGGIIAIPKKKLYEIGGFDEYFKMWGVEDMDMKTRLEKSGLALKILSIEEAPTFHQWHPSASTEEFMPVLWLKAMEKYEKRKTEVKVPYLSQPFKEPQRPALKILKNIDAALANGATTFTFEYPTLQSYILFAKTFCALPSGAILIVQQQFEPIQSNKKARLAGFFQKINHLLEHLSVSYRITEFATFETELVTFINVRDFLFYFITENQELIADYVFDTVFQKSICCILVKK